jgi:hypothetical protein
LEDDAPLSVIAGRNNSGKSSIAGAVEYAFTGSACGYRGRDVSRLIRDGQTRMRVSLKVGRWDLVRTKTSGTTQAEIARGFGVVPDGLPLLFNQQHCLVGGSKLMRALLDSVGENSADNLVSSMIDSEMIGRFKIVQEKNQGSVKNLITLCEEMRRNCRIPGDPVAPERQEPDKEACERLERDLEGATLSSNQFSERIRSANSEIALLRRCKDYLEAVHQYEVSLSLSRDDVLGESRAFLRSVADLDVRVMSGWVQHLASAGFQSEADALAGVRDTVEVAVRSAQGTLTANPVPKSLCPKPVLKPETEARFQALQEKSVAGVEDECARLCRIRDQLVTEERALAESLIRLRADLDGLLADKTRWQVYRESLEHFTKAKAKLEADWLGWDALIEFMRDHQDAQRRAVQEKILGRVGEFGRNVLSGRSVALTDEGELTLDGRLLETASASERWRVSVCVMAAIALYLRSPILVLDGADILDDQNRVALVRFLARDIVPRFAHTLLMTTARGDGLDERPFSFNASKWIIHGGHLLKVPKTQGQNVLAGV